MNLVLLADFAFWQAFNAFMGYIEACYWYFRNIVVLSPIIEKSEFAKNLNLHSALFAVRVLVAGILCKGNLHLPIFTQILFATALILSHPYFHLGTMYWMRNKLDNRVYLLGFYDVNVIDEKESSWLDKKLHKFRLKQFTYRFRLGCLIVSCLLILFPYIH